MSKYSTYLGTDTWALIRKMVYERDNYQCRLCGSGKNLRVHHIHYLDDYGKERLANLSTFCANCHTMGHSFLEIKSGRLAHTKEALAYIAVQEDAANDPVFDQHELDLDEAS